MENRTPREEPLLFLTGIYPDEWRDAFCDPSYNANIQIAADVLQRHLIRGFEENLGHPIPLLNAPYIGVFPRTCKLARMKAFDFSHTEGAKDRNIGFWNIPVWRHIAIYRQSRKGIRDYVRENPNGVVMAYTLNLRNMYRLRYAKKKAPSIRTCLVAPDLPLFMNVSASLPYRVMKTWEDKRIRKRLRWVDSYVMLTEQMNEYLGADRYCVVEGIAAEREWAEKTPSTEKTVLYTGTLEEKYGVLRLVEAFSRIDDPDARLCICGKGECESALVEAKKTDPRIRYLGQVPHDRVLELQREAAVTVNPRPAGEAFTKYSFPSKNLEYLVSGVPLVACKLAGIPSEYDPYICYAQDDTVDALKEAIESILRLTPQEREQRGRAAFEFVTTQKNPKMQTKRILDMLKRE